MNREKLGGVTAYHPYLIEYRASEGRCSDNDESLHTEDIQEMNRCMLYLLESHEKIGIWAVTSPWPLDLSIVIFSTRRSEAC